MSININGLKAYKEIQSIVKPEQGLGQSQEPGKVQGKEGFGTFLKEAIGDVNNMQNIAEDHIEGFISRKPGYNSHDAMLALEKAEIAFQLMNTVRGKIIRAYEDVLRTQI